MGQYPPWSQPFPLCTDLLDGQKTTPPPPPKKTKKNSSIYLDKQAIIMLKFRTTEFEKHHGLFAEALAALTLTLPALYALVEIVWVNS